MEYKKKILTVILTCICLIVCVGLVVIGHKSVSYQGLFTMFAGLFGILFMLYLYNRKFN